MELKKDFDKNLEIGDEGKIGRIKVDKKVFSLETVYLATYEFLDKAFFAFNSSEKFLEIRFKLKEEDTDPVKLGRSIQNELVNYAVYIVRSSRSQGVRDAIISEAFDTGKETEKSGEEEVVGVEEFLEDDKGIAEPWSPGKEKQGNDDKEVVEGIEIDRESCIRCGLCANKAPENFEEDEGRIEIVSGDLTGELEEVVGLCPVNALKLVDDRNV